MGSRRGPVNERATTRNYGVARERKHTAHGPGRGNAAGQRSESSYLAKVGVAGSNPVVRSRETTGQTLRRTLRDLMPNPPRAAAVPAPCRAANFDFDAIRIEAYEQARIRTRR